VEHEFTYDVVMSYDELPAPGVLAEDAVRDLIAAAQGARPEGPVFVLHARRSLGVGFNPVRFYYAWHEDALLAVVAEVTNTPWGESETYVLDPQGGRAAKTMHVSPFQPMGQEYAWKLTEPGERLTVHLENHQDGERAFDATLVLRRAEGAPRRGQSLRFLAGIYAQALRLKLKGARYHPHPRTAR
jgi:hypothetical protein